MRIVRGATLGLVILLSVPCLPQPVPGQAQPEMRQRVLERFDRDGDGRLSPVERAELQAAMSSRQRGRAPEGGPFDPPVGSPVHREIAEKALAAHPNDFNLPHSVPDYYFGYGLSGNDFWPFPGWRAFDGETAGFDTYMLADPTESMPGEDQVHSMSGTSFAGLTTEFDTGQPGDRFILGDHRTAWYAGRQPGRVDDDFVYIRHFLTDASVIVLHGAPAEYALVSTTDPVQGTALLLRKGDPEEEADDDLIAHLEGVHPAALDLSGDQFEYAHPPDRTPVAPDGLFQLQTPQVEFWPTVDVDEAGNIYLAFRTTAQLAAGRGPGGDLGLAKLSPSGELLWQGNYGDGSWEKGRVPHVPLAGIVVDAGHVFYASYVNARRWDGKKLLLKIDAADGRQVAHRELNESRGVDNVTDIIADGDGNLFLGGSTSSLSSFPDVGAGPYIQKIRQSDLEVEYFSDSWRHRERSQEGHGGIDLLRGGSGPRSDRICNSGWTTSRYADGFNHHRLWAACLDGLGKLLWLNVFTDAAGPPGWAWAVASDPNGQLFVAGHIQGPLSTLGDRYGGAQDIFVAKLDPNGEVIAIRTIGSDMADEVVDLAMTDDALYLVGHTYGGLFVENRGARRADGIIVKLDHDLSVVTGVQLGSDAEDHFTSVTMAGGTLHVAGLSEGSFVAPIDDRGYNTDPFVIRVDRDTLRVRNDAIRVDR